MVPKDKIILSLFSVVEEVNSVLDGDKRLEKSIETTLMGEGSKLDSLGLINFIIATEQKIRDQFQKSVILTNEDLFETPESPFRTIGTLADYITRKLEMLQ